MGRESLSILITGASSGIGRATALALADSGVTLHLAGRSQERHEPLLAELEATGARARFLPVDLADLASVRDGAERFLASGEPLHVLLNNAGLAGARGRTENGFERTFGVNHLGHFLLTELLLDRLHESAPARIVNVASDAHFSAETVDWDALQRPTRSLTGLPEYAVSKLCNVLHARELAERLADSGVTTYALHPGVVATEVWRKVPWGLRQLIRLFMESPEAGARTSEYCAVSEAAGSQSGLYYANCEPKPPSRLARDATLTAELRERSLAWTGLGAGVG
ncbi:SDR family NAD(P)-dependent oxidoreductase [Ectothiorhodospiraceae bacterium WFHF3C12]|nr:SDR family NAD(P)-dependent oxidoreductase [Ectothiorhodospiraceae bacterium WFHF3C12]